MKTKDFVAAIADRLFLPVEIEYRDYFTRPLRIFVLLFFLYSLIIALPPIIHIVKENSIFLPFINGVMENPSFWGKWIPYINFALEVVFFLMIGGSAFSEWVAANSEATFKDYEEAVEKAKEREVLEKKDELVSEIKSYYALIEGINLINLIPRFISIFNTSKRVSNMLVKDVAKVNARFLATKIAVSFPGGIYGLFAFVLFGALIQIKVAKFYLPTSG